MMINTEINTGRYQRLSALLDYPEEGFVERIRDIQLYLDEHEPGHGAILKGFSEVVTTLPLHRIQELHTRSFDVQAITTLDLGYLLFGDDYKRAELLVNLSREHQLTGNDCGDELADHLPNVIRLLSKLNDEPLKVELVKKLICPGLRKMIREFDPENLAAKNEIYKRHHKTLIDMPVPDGTIYRKPLNVLLVSLQDDFGIEDMKVDRTAGFLGAIGNEMNIEG